MEKISEIFAKNVVTYNRYMARISLAIIKLNSHSEFNLILDRLQNLTPVTTSACIVMRWRHTSSITSPLNDEYRPRNLVRPKDDHFLFRAERSGAERSGTAWLPGWPAVAAAIDWHMADEVSVFRIFVCVLWSSWLRPLQHCGVNC